MAQAIKYMTKTENLADVHPTRLNDPLGDIVRVQGDKVQFLIFRHIDDTPAKSEKPLAEASGLEVNIVTENTGFFSLEEVTEIVCTAYRKTWKNKNIELAIATS